jgi:hypothetical protein
MYLPFTYSLKDALQDRLGRAMMSLIPQETLNELQQYFIVDFAGVFLWTIIFLVIGVALGRTIAKYDHRARRGSLGTRSTFTDLYFG